MVKTGPQVKDHYNGEWFWYRGGSHWALVCNHKGTAITMPDIILRSGHGKDSIDGETRAAIAHAMNLAFPDGKGFNSFNKV